MDKMTEILKKKTENITDADVEIFLDTYDKTYTNVKNKASKNKKAYFRIQNALIYLNATVSVVNIIITFVSVENKWSYAVPVLSMIASVITVISTILIKNLISRNYLKLG